MEKINTTYIKRQLWILFSNYKYQLFNVFVFNNESDFLAVSRSNYTVEVEMKTSRADFKNDFKKTIGYRNYGKNKHELLQSDDIFKPNKFCFAVPEGLITKDEVPDYAGLIYIGRNAYYVKHPKFLHKHNLLQDNRFLKQILNKFYYQNMDLRRVLNAREWEIKYRQRRIEYE